jgi:hypothetical protein
VTADAAAAGDLVDAIFLMRLSAILASMWPLGWTAWVVAPSRPHGLLLLVHAAALPADKLNAIQNDIRGQAFVVGIPVLRGPAKNLDLGSLKHVPDRLSWLTNSTLVYEPQWGGWGRGIAGSQPMSCAHGAQKHLRSNSVFSLCYKPKGLELRAHTGWLSPKTFLTFWLPFYRTI